MRDSSVYDAGRIVAEKGFAILEQDPMQPCCPEFRRLWDSLNDVSRTIKNAGFLSATEIANRFH